ncbi:heme A synthase [Paenibacillus dendritiformis]|uniref:COX15/CtaA family protein n=1 Tax=Paenibacillus dendritiformis TaxID=130049 RepID=UPI00143DF309|nr:COX15/CtaA family protein [Paenibacillus dendritiformis]NKI24368.1 heme A synthase [Paenibacillus dendritiformis]NRF98192.1 heme A synthase [Paenibacillus dendritiformis]
MLSFRYRLFAWSSFVGMFLVLLAGALVTKTGSGRGCGDDWPLCNGKFVPAYTVESFIEYSHRFVTGIVGIIVVLTFWYTWRYLRQHREAAAYAGGTLLFTIVQALMGAAAVKWPQQPAVMALHFGISLLAVASSMLLVAWCYRADNKTEPHFSRQFPKSVYIAAWGIWVCCYGVVYLGAYIRHTGTEGACMGWPLCNGQLIPYLSGASGIVFAHRAAAAVLLLLLAGLHILVRRAFRNRRADSSSGTVTALALAIAQIMSGALLTATIADENAYLFASLLHNVLATLLFGVLTDIAIRSWKHRMH